MGSEAGQTIQIAIGFGSNIGDRAAHLRDAGQEMAAHGAVRWRAWSALYETAPVGPVADQPPFLNQVAIAETELAPRALLILCERTEQAHHRVRTVRWGPRTLDLDILLYGDQAISEPDLFIPHPEMTKRAFVLVPLAEIAPHWRVPGTDKDVRDLAAAIAGRNGIQLWQSSAI